MTPDQAIADATAVATEAVARSAAAPAPPREPAPFGLTSREQDVLRLLARRYTDREVAEALFISPRTVGRHVTGIFNKLGVHSRREAAAVATHNHLV
jgi:DNA-binding NarL/FixJ family response regulator